MSAIFISGGDLQPRDPDFLAYFLCHYLILRAFSAPARVTAGEIIELAFSDSHSDLLLKCTRDFLGQIFLEAAQKYICERSCRLPLRMLAGVRRWTRGSFWPARHRANNTETVQSVAVEVSIPPITHRYSDT